MLLIDLLPEDRRPVERTPLPRLLTVIGGVLLAGVELALIALFLGVKVPEAERRRQEVKSRLDEMRQLMVERDKLKAEQAEYEQRKAIITQLCQKRIRWAEKLDALCDPTVLPDMVWLKSLKVESKPGMLETTEKYLVMEGWARGDESRVRIEAINKFIKRLESNERFYCDFEGSLSAELEWKDVRLHGGRDRHKDAPRDAMWFKTRAKFKNRDATLAAAGGP